MRHLRWTLPPGVLLLWAAGLAARVPGGEPHLSRSPGRAALPHVEATPRLGPSAAESRARRSPVVEVEALNPGTTLARDLCLTAAVGAGAASECGDLRLAHALPAVQTLGRGRAPVLLYSSQHASPYPIVAAHVTLPAGTAELRRVDATLRVNGQPRAQGIWKGTLWPASGAARIAVGFDASADVTGPYRYTLEVRAHYGTSSVASTVRGHLVVVNRRESAIGAGWSVAGVESLVMDPFGQPALWVGGDGSTRRYTPLAGDTLWSAPPLDGPDLLRRAGSGWERVISGGTRVVFDSAGRHVGTRNRLGHETRFLYDGQGRLFRIQVPPTGSGLAYTFVYGADGRLDRVEAPDTGSAPRVVTVHGGGLRVDSISDPDGTRIRFGYADATGRRIGSRTNRLGHTTLFRYDAGGRVASSRVELANGDSIVWRLRALESLGLAAGDGSGATDTTQAYARLDGPRTEVGDTTAFWLDRFGAPRRIRNALGHETLLTRADPRFPALVTRMDGPVRIRPEDQQPERRTVSASYDERGRIRSSTDSSTLRVNADGSRTYATTRYEYGDVHWPDFVTRTIAPEGEETRFGYDPQTGSRLWQKPSGDAARADTVRFAYYTDPAEPGYAPGLPKWVQSMAAQSRGEQPERYAYDAHGNLASVTGPDNETTHYQRDGLGRDTLVTSPIGNGQSQTSRTRYNPAGQVWETVAEGPRVDFRHMGALKDHWVSTHAPAQTLRVRNAYDDEGRLLEVARWSEPDTAGVDTVRTWWAYDALGRRVKETVRNRNEQGGLYLSSDTTIYDAAGNAVEVRTRRGDVLTMTYDELNRLRRRVVPSATYDGMHFVSDQRAATVKYRNWNFPLFRADANGNLTVPNDGTSPAGLNIAQDVAEFTYDELGNLRTANNNDARITRTYHLNGQLASETQQIRTYAGADFSQHSYRLEYENDLNGRRTEMLLPEALVSGAAWMRRTHYGYDPATGALRSVGDSTGEATVDFAYNEEGQLRQMDTRAGNAQVTERVRYDAVGRVRWQNRKRDGIEIHADTFRYDPRGKIVRSWTMGDSTANVYSGMGMLAWSYSDRYASESDQEEEHLSDALGNTYMRRQLYFSASEDLTTRDSTTSIYAAKTGRLVQNGTEEAWNLNRSAVHRMVYDSAGNQVRYVGVSLIPYPGLADGYAVLEENTNSYYGADGKLRVIDRRTCAFGQVPTSSTLGGTYYEIDCVPPPYGSRATFEEHRYDALGRRVLTRTAQGWACELSCVNGVTRTVWDGDQVVAEIRAHAGEPERDSGVATGLGAAPQFYGRVLYQHAGGLDRPALLVRLDYDSIFAGAQVIVPQTNWLGNYDSGTFAATGSGQGPCVRLPIVDNEVANPEEPNEPGAVGGDSITHCVEVHWPAPYLWKNYQRRQGPTPKSWMGSLILGMRDESGQMYRRNRYYDPNTGRFTQEDPIGIAGGLNVYGFANGDPVSYSDPYGLSPSNCLKNPTLACRISQWIGNVVFGEHELDPNSKTGALAGPGLADPVAIATGAAATRMVAGRALVSAGAGSGAASAGAQRGGVFAHSLTIQFGKDPNQVSHAFRHVIRAGLDPEDVSNAVRQHLPMVANQIQAGKPLNQVITVGGQRLQYTAFELPNGVINVGRIHPVP